MPTEFERIFFQDGFTQDDLIRLCDAQSRTIEQQAKRIAELEFRLNALCGSVMVPEDKWLEITKRSTNYGPLKEEHRCMTEFIRKLSVIIEEYNQEIDE